MVMLDKRGTGMSDKRAELPGLDQRIDDLRAVMDAAAMDKAALLGISEGDHCQHCSLRPIPTAAKRWFSMAALRAFRRDTKI